MEFKRKYIVYGVITPKKGWTMIESALNEHKFGVKREQNSDDLGSFWVDEEVAT